MTARIAASDLPVALRRKLVSASPSCSGEGAPRSSEPSRRPAEADHFACHRCPETSTSLAAAQRHADANNHPRFAWVWSK